MFDTDPAPVIRPAVLSADFRRATFGGPRRNSAPCPWVKVAIRSIPLRGVPHLQFSYFDERKNVTRNIPLTDASPALDELIAWAFGNIHITTAAEEIDLQISKKGKVLVRTKPVAVPTEVPIAHNRTKDHPLPEGKADRLLEVMGVMSAGGQVRATMRAKFTQINEFLRQLRHTLETAELLGLDRPLEILDCGCGSSHLTLAAHHYLNEILGVPARLIGVDVNQEVIRKSAAKAGKLGAAINFQVNPIAAAEAKPDVVLALHACDTATDDAIARAVLSGAKVLLCVPCCHHHLNTQLKANGPAEVLRPLLRHGLLLQRSADLLTDALRALLLRIQGYKTDVVEFVGSEHTARNLMIRAVKGEAPNDPRFVREYRELKSFLGVEPYLEAMIPVSRSAGELIAPIAVEESGAYPTES
ncbi:MAG: SAM-dependent methyltransferase [Fimbriiglobus sp.]|nr:SAM-dependent methyltransferase [Fimbriiglobus sp.]